MMFETHSLIFVGGKGGVGKTTVACSLGLHLSNRFKTLVVSTDPAHSVSDSLMQSIGERVQKVNHASQLFALEINAEKIYQGFLETHREKLKRIIDTTTNLDDEDIDMMLETTIPGLDEVMGLKTVTDYVRNRDYEKIIVDTAPTGHALRLLAMPHLLDDWIKVMAKLRWKYREVITTFKGAYESDSGDDFLVEMKKTVKRIESLLKDEHACAFLPVTILTDMALSETERLTEALQTYGVSARYLIFNQVLTETHDGLFFQKRKAEQALFKAKARKAFANVHVIEIPLFTEEVKGVERLAQIAALFP